jgi:hypothetical protein
MGAHFMGRLQRKVKEILHKVNNNHHRAKFIPFHISEEMRNDLKVWRRLLKRASQGLDMNLLIDRLPTHFYRVDASTHGMGGYNHRGKAWRFYLPSQLRHNAHINVLELIAQVIAIWLDILDGVVKRGDVVHTEGDNTTALSWLRKSNFNDSGFESLKGLKIARHLATILADYSVKHSAAWVPGKVNEIADSLSRDFHLSDIELTSFISSTCPQTPPNLTLQTLPSEITSWIVSMLQKKPANSPSPKEPPPPKLEHGDSGKFSSNELDYIRTNSSTLWKDRRSLQSSPSSLNPFETGNFEAENVRNWLAEQSALTSAAWQRPSWSIHAPTPACPPMECTTSFYKGNWRPTEKRTLQ